MQLLFSLFPFFVFFFSFRFFFPFPFLFFLFWVWKSVVVKKDLILYNLHMNVNFIWSFDENLDLRSQNWLLFPHGPQCNVTLNSELAILKILNLNKKILIIINLLYYYLYKLYTLPIPALNVLFAICPVCHRRRIFKVR